MKKIFLLALFFNSILLGQITSGFYETYFPSDQVIVAVDTIPSSFSFTDLTNQEYNSSITSIGYPIIGFDSAYINITSNTYSINETFSDGDYNGWTVSSGSYAVVDSVGYSGLAKSLRCATAGIIYIPCNQAYGSWEFDLRKANTGNAPNVVFIDNLVTLTSSNSYALSISATESVDMVKRVGGTASYPSYSADNYITWLTNYRFKVTRNTNGSFSYYIKGGVYGTAYILVSSVTNPFTDNTYAQSNYFVLDLDAGDMIANIQCSYGLPQYKIGTNGSFTNDSQIINSNDTIYLKTISPSICTTSVNNIINIGGISDTWTVTTKIDTTPTAFTFTDVTNATLSTEYTSNAIVVSGVGCNSIASVNGGTFRKGALGSFISTQTSVFNNDTLWVKNTSSGSTSTAVHCTLTVGGVSDIYSITTISVTYDSSISTPLASADDGFYKPTYTDIIGTKLIIGGSSDSCSFAIRFRGITIPNGATIDSARLYLYGGGEYSATTATMRIYGEDVDSIGVFIGDDSGMDFNTRDNTLTTAYVADTNMPTWSTNTLYTYVVTDIVSELVATRNYTNEAMGIFVIDQGSGATANRRCWSYDNGSLYPILKTYFHY